MYKIIALFLLFTLPQYGIAQEIPSQRISSEIVSITVFLNNAEIQRQKVLEIPEGKSEIIFENISSRILDKGLKVSLDNDAKVYTVSIEKDINDFKESKQYIEFEDSLTNITNKKLTSKIRLETFKKEMVFLEANIKVHNTSDITFSKIDEAQTYFAKKIEAVQEKIVKEEQTYESFVSASDDFLKERKKLKEKYLKTNSKVKITVVSNKATSSTVQLRYLVSNAVWKPLYSIRATEENDKIQIEYQAQIYNDTGVDWENKPITLAILDSSDDIEKPDLEVWTLDDNNYEYSKNRVANFKRKPRKNDNDDGEPEEFDVLEIDDLSTRFELKDLHNIPSDARPHLIDVINYEKEVAYYNLSIPKVKNGTFLIARIKDWDNLGLMDGQVNLYYNNTYQGYSNLETQQINDTLDISLGKENSFTVSRKKIKGESKKNLIGFNIKEDFTYKIIVKNNKNTKGEIQIKDQIPISISKDIEIKVLNASNGKIDPLTGEIKWNLTLNPEEVKKITLRYSIKYPKSMRDQIRYNKSRIVTPRYF